MGSWTAFRVQVGIQVDSGLAFGVQVGLKMGSGWVQVRLLRFRVGSGLAFKSSRWLSLNPTSTLKIYTSSSSS